MENPIRLKRDAWERELRETKRDCRGCLMQKGERGVEGKEIC